MSAHTPEPWIHFDEKGQGHQIRARVPNLDKEIEIQHVPIKPHLTVGDDGRVYVMIEYETFAPLAGPDWREMQKANAERIVACVNGCAGKNPEAFDELLVTAHKALDSMDGGYDEAPCHRSICPRSECAQCRRVDALRAAIAKARRD